MEQVQALSYLVLPAIPGLTVHHFIMDIYSNRMDEPHSSSLDPTITSHLPPPDQVKAILMFCDEPFCPPEIGYGLMSRYPNTVIAGGYVDNLMSIGLAADTE